MSEVKGSGGNLHLQAPVAAHQVKGRRAWRAAEKGGAERLLDGLHRRRLGAARQGMRGEILKIEKEKHGQTKQASVPDQAAESDAMLLLAGR